MNSKLVVNENEVKIDENTENESSDVDNEANNHKVIRLNLPASLSVSKLENKDKEV